jgi:dipeptidyl aminopeptidase/acylaminoacyl peptidase
MAAALRARGIRTDLVTFPGEGHGFRQAGTIVRALEAELAFYREVLGLGPENA